MARDSLGFGVIGSLPLDALGRIGREVERLGYSHYWMNIIPGLSDPAAMLEVVAAATTKIDIGLGVVPMDTYPPNDMREQLSRGIPTERVIFGVGAGYTTKGAAALVEGSIRELRRLDAPLRIAVGGYGPLILRAAGRSADAMCLAWMTTNRLEWALGEVRSGASEVDRAAPPTYLYVRSATGPDAQKRISEEMAVYGRQPHHVRHQQAMKATEPVGVVAQNKDEAAAVLAPFDVEYPVVRGLPVDADDADEWLEIARLFAPTDPVAV